MFRTALLAASAMMALAAPAVASAALLRYEISSVAGGTSGYSFSFDFNTSTTPLVTTPSLLRYAPVTITYRLPNTTTVYTETISNLGLSFFTSIDQGGIAIGRLPRGDDRLPRFFQEPGNALFTGTTAAPVFKTGTFQLSTMPKNVPSDVQVFNYKVVVTDLSAVPEPATWGMMILGFGTMGGAMRIRRRSASTVAA